MPEKEKNEKLYQLKHYLNAINSTKEDLLRSDDSTWTQKYPPYVINRCLSQHYDCILQVNAMNGRHFLPKDMQFSFLINSIRIKKRFGGRWISKTKLKNLEYVKEFFGYSNRKAKDALNILTNEQVKNIIKKLEMGGKK